MSKYIYSDINSTLKSDPTGNYEIEYDRDAVIQSVKNILSTINGERVRNGIGSTLVRYLFQPMSSDTTDEIRTTIIRNIREYEPRIQRLNVRVKEDKTNNQYKVYIDFTVNRFSQPIQYQTNLRAMG